MNNNFNGLLFFTNDQCAVCQSVWPKLLKMIEKKFPTLTLEKVNFSIDAVRYPNYEVFTVPTLLVYLEGQEFIRLTGVFSLNELETRIHRLISLIKG